MEKLETRMLLATLSLDDGALVTNSTRVSADFKHIDAQAAEVRFANNNFNYGTWRSFEESMSIAIPRFPGTNWVNAQIRYESGALEHVYDSIKYEPPTLNLDDGADRTNSRRVHVQFDRVTAGAAEVRFDYNGFNYQPWQSFDADSTVFLPNWIGTNWVNAQIKYEDGDVVSVYDSIEYVRPTIQLNSGDQTTNSRQVRVEFDRLATGVSQMRFAYNGFDYGPWQTLTPATNVSLPNWPGTNWVNAQIQYADGDIVTASDSIEYVRPRFQINQGADLTNAREIDLTFADVTSKARDVRFAYNGFNYGDWRPFHQRMQVTLPNWEGANWVNTQIRYENGTVASVYDAIDYIRPIYVTSCGQCVTFVMNIQDGANEGFRDTSLGEERVAAFKYALGIWSALLKASYDSETIYVDATMDPMGGTADKATLGGAGPNDYERVAGSHYGDALANHVLGRDVHPKKAEIFARFNTDVDNSYVLGDANWYYGTAGKPGGDYDFVTTVLHEIGHGLNYITLATKEGLWNGGIPGVYDRFVEDADGETLAAMSNDERKAAITSDQLYWSGAGGKHGNGGERPKLYAPSAYSQGSSVMHLDETEHQHNLMSPAQDAGSKQHEPGSIVLGMLQDMGWHIRGNNSGTASRMAKYPTHATRAGLSTIVVGAAIADSSHSDHFDHTGPRTADPSGLDVNDDLSTEPVRRDRENHSADQHGRTLILMPSAQSPADHTAHEPEAGYGSNPEEQLHELVDSVFSALADCSDTDLMATTRLTSR